MEKWQSDRGSNPHETSSAVTTEGNCSSHVQLSKSNDSVMLLDYKVSTLEDSDCINNDVVQGDNFSWNPSLIQAVNEHKEKLSGQNNGNGNSQSEECSLSLCFSQSNCQAVNQEKMIHLSSSPNTVDVDSSVLVGGASLQNCKESNDVIDFCIDDFDIDDFSENDIPDYCDEPAALSGSGNSSALPQFCERGHSNSCDKKSVGTPTAVIKLTEPWLPG